MPWRRLHVNEQNSDGEPQKADRYFSNKLSLASLSKILRERPEIFWRKKLVANPVNSLNKNGTGRIALDFVTKLGDAVVYSPETSTLAFWPCGVDELLAGDDDSWPRHQELQDFEFSKGYVYGLARATHFHGLEIKKNLRKIRPLIAFLCVRI